MSKYLRSIAALYAEQYDRRTKTCPQCGTQYCDVTKRNLMCCCTPECTNAKMVTTRKARGSYVRTATQNAKMAVTCKKIRAAGGMRIRDPEAHRAAIQRSIDEGRHPYARGDAHWTRQSGASERISKSVKGRKLSPDACRRMSISAARRVRTKRETLYTSARGGVRADLGMYFRSCWEANFARILQGSGVDWQYEPESFTLPDGTTYTPDFRVGAKHYELKGRMTEKCMHKIDAFRRLGHDLIVIGPNEYDTLRQTFKIQIPLWEGR